MTSNIDIRVGQIMSHNTRNTLIIATVALVLIILLVFGARRARESAQPERMNANVGSGGNAENIPRPLKKAHQCYTDGDCPAETECNRDGICIPKLNRLPSGVGSMYGLGREKEKTVI